MDERILFRKIYPKPGVIVRFPGTLAVLPPEGADVAWTGKNGRYWRRRHNCGDITIVPTVESAPVTGQKSEAEAKEKLSGSIKPMKKSISDIVEDNQ